MTDPIQGSVILLYGPAGSGKTQTAASFPSPVFIGGAAGKRYLPSKLKKRCITITRSPGGWEKFLAFTKKAPKVKVKTFVVDLATDLYDACYAYFCSENNIEHPEEAGGHGRGWSKLRGVWYDGMAALCEAAAEIDATVLFIAHSKILEVDMVTQPANQVTTDLPKQVNDLVVRGSDHSWYLGYQNYDDDDEVDKESRHRYDGDAPRVLVMRGSAEVYAKMQDPECAISTLFNLPKTKQYDFIRKHYYDASED